MAAIQYSPGDRFFFLTYLRDAPKATRLRQTIFKCDCGNEITAYLGNVKRGNTKSCGCFRKKHSSEKSTIHGRSKLHDRAYKSWTHMRARCFNPNDAKFPDYGGRGITVCERWASFENFIADMGEPPPGTTIDRINNDGDYEPENCRWATSKMQANNRRSSRIVCAFGESLTLAAWSERVGISQNALWYRLNSGWSTEKALTAPTKNKLIEKDGRRQTVAQWAMELGLSTTLIHHRLKRGWIPEKALEPPKR